MPQMNPIWWLNLFLFFIMTFILTNSVNYFFKNLTPKKFSMKISKKTNIWKW